MLSVFDSISAEDILKMVAEGVSEKLTVEYKEKLNLGTSPEKHKFLELLCSLSNSAGGRVYYGISEKRTEKKNTGIPEAALGLANLAPDIKGIMMQLLGAGISPRLNGVRIREVEGGFERGPVIVVDVPKSWKPPHVVSYEHSSVFSARNDHGKYNMEFGQISDAFKSGEALEARVRGFRAERLALVSAGEGPIKLPSRYVALHVVPLSTAVRESFPMQQLEQAAGHEFRPLYKGHSNFGERRNLDGLMRFAMAPQAKAAQAYSLLFRNGVIESFDSLLVGGDSRVDRIFCSTLNNEILRNVPIFLKILESLQVQPPVSVMLSLVGVKGILLDDGNNRPRFPTDVPKAFDRDRLLFDEVLIEDFNIPMKTLLKPLLDEVSQAAGYEEVPYQY